MSDVVDAEMAPYHRQLAGTMADAKQALFEWQIAPSRRSSDQLAIFRAAAIMLLPESESPNFDNLRDLAREGLRVPDTDPDEIVDDRLGSAALTFGGLSKGEGASFERLEHANRVADILFKLAIIRGQASQTRSATEAVLLH